MTHFQEIKTYSIYKDICFTYTHKIRFDFLKVMPLYKWQYCHELLKYKKGYCDWCFSTFLYEFEKYGIGKERILQLECLNKNEKIKLTNKNK